MAQKPPSQKKPAPSWAQALVDNLNRNVMAEEPSTPAESTSQRARRRAQAMVDGLNPAAAQLPQEPPSDAPPIVGWKAIGADPAAGRKKKPPAE